MKRRPYRNPRILKAAEGESCTICSIQDGTIVFCHLNEGFAGKGMGQKADDFAGFFGCKRCHDIYDGRQPGKISQWIILRAVVITWRRLLDGGIIK